jgi:hypothetical protein
MFISFQKNNLSLGGTDTLSLTLNMDLASLLSRKDSRGTSNSSLIIIEKSFFFFRYEFNVSSLIKTTYGTEVRSVLATSNQVSNRLGSLTTGLGNNNSVGRLLGRSLLVGLTGSDADTTSSGEDSNSLS